MTVETIPNGIFGRLHSLPAEKVMLASRLAEMSCRQISIIFGRYLLPGELNCRAAAPLSSCRGASASLTITRTVSNCSTVVGKFDERHYAVN